jgi:hypothetical protein
MAQCSEKYNGDDLDDTRGTLNEHFHPKSGIGSVNERQLESELVETVGFHLVYHPTTQSKK